MSASRADLDFKMSILDVGALLEELADQVEAYGFDDATAEDARQCVALARLVRATAKQLAAHVTERERRRARE